RALDQLETITFAGIDYQDAYGSPLLSHAAERFLKAKILLQLGRFEQALPLLESFGETSYYEEAFVAPAAFHQGEVYEALRRPAEARQQYQRVVDLWQDCQPPLCTWVDQARKRMTALSGPS
ncbi:MAG: hypothetical protein P8Y44_09895, partial [Acidobacteriota bacterium]